MESAFQGIPFEDPARARANLDAIRGRVAPATGATLPTLLAESPDPDGALNYFERFTTSAPREVLDHLARNPTSLHYLLTIFSYSRFLSETLVQQPELISWLDRPSERSKLARVRSREDLEQEFARFEATALNADRSTVLARFKRREYLRIMLKDVLGIATLAETTIELSTLADVLLEEARVIVERELVNRFGQPTELDASGRIGTARFAIISLGKLGGAELNYSSDIDLFYLFSGEGETAGAEAADSRISNTEFFIRLAHGITRLISDVTPEGAVFRVDLRLRPQGKEGDLAVSLAAALDYYRRRADGWERQMLIKARYSAGDAALARAFVYGVQPNIYETAADFEAIESIRDSRERIDRKLRAELVRGGAGRGLNLKLVPGGIRDIEFLVQCLQRLYGGTDPWVRTGGTLVALTKLFDKGHLHQRDYYRLSTAYQFFRKVEHRLQLVMGQQTHSLPTEAGELERLSRRVGLTPMAGLSPGEHFLKVVERHLEQVREIHDRVIHSTAAAVTAGGEEFALRATAADLRAPSERSWAAQMEILRANHPALDAVIQEVKPAGRAQKAFYRFLSAAASSSERFRLLEGERGLLPQVAQIFEASEFLGEILIREPERIALLAGLGTGQTDANQRELGLSSTESMSLDRRLESTLRASVSLSRRMADLRAYYRDEQFLWGAREITEPRDVFQALADYSRLAEQILRAAFVIACQDVRETTGEAPEGRLAILALGRLGMREMDIGSDADLVFVCDEAASRAMAFWRRVAERLIQVVSSYTREGTIFPVDARLRPGGYEGELVQTLDYFADYFAARAEPWEVATCLKLRSVAGDSELGAEVLRRLQMVLAGQKRDREKLARDLHAMRLRLEQEAQAAREEDNFKSAPGGSYDVDYLLSFLTLSATRDLAFGRSALEQISALCAAGALTAGQAQVLREGVYFLRGLDHATRLVTGRAHVALPERLHWDAVARLLSAYIGRKTLGSELPAALQKTCTQLRRAYEEVFAAHLSSSRTS